MLFCFIYLFINLLINRRSNKMLNNPSSDRLAYDTAGVLEANFVEPAHDKQGFERTTVLARLEARLIQMQKTYWSVTIFDDKVVSISSVIHY